MRGDGHRADSLDCNGGDNHFKKHFMLNAGREWAEMKKHRINMRITGGALLVCAAFLLVLSPTYARYTTQVRGTGTASVAVWGTATEFTTPIQLDQLHPGTEVEFPFKVTNKNDGKISDVGQNYSITVKSTGNLPVVFRLTTDSSKGTAGGTVAAAPDPLVFSDGAAEVKGGFLPHTTETVHAYILTISWPENDQNMNGTDAKYADEIDLVTLTINAQQAVPTAQ